MSKNISKQKEMQANNEAFYRALRSFDVKTFSNYLKVWEPKQFKRFNHFNELGKKKILCHIIIDFKDKLNDEALYKKAKKWFDEHDVGDLKNEKK